MRNLLKTLLGISSVILIGLILDTNAYAAPGSAIESGVFADDIDLSGMTAEEAETAIETRVAERQNSVITLTDGDEFTAEFTGADLGYSWSNEEIVGQAAALGKSGNIVQRYKALKDLTRENQVYDIEYSIDEQKLSDLMASLAVQYDREAVDASLTRADGAFSITEGQTGRALDQTATGNAIKELLTGDWDGSDVTLEMVTGIVEPQGKEEDLTKVKDVLGTFTTSYSTSGSERSANIANACKFINGTTLYPGQEFSTLDTITPFTEANGYYLAGSYLNGKVVESFGGGICQVSTTLYNAVLLSELDVTERHNHSMIISYVKPSMDAAIAESSGKNFRFVNSTEYPIYIEGYTTSDKKITFTIYGVEYREATHKVTYESETLETMVPETEEVYTDAALPAGQTSGKQSAHIGYKARLWKNTYENGTLVSRDEVNSSTYNKSPRCVTIGVSTDNVDVYNMLMEAAATNSVDTAVAAAAQAAAILGTGQAADAAAAQTTDQTAETPAQ